MSSRASSTRSPTVLMYKAPSPSTRASSATERTLSFLCVIVLAALDHPARRYRRVRRLGLVRLGGPRRPDGVVDRVGEPAGDVDHPVHRADRRAHGGQHALELDLAG